MQMLSPCKPLSWKTASICHVGSIQVKQDDGEYVRAVDFVSDANNFQADGEEATFGKCIWTLKLFTFDVVRRLARISALGWAAGNNF